MFEAISAALSAWRTVLHISEWTGLSVGALAVLAGLVYLDPRLLKPAITAAIAIAGFYGGVVYGDRTGRADVEAQWADARQAAIAAAAERDAMTEQQLAVTYTPQLATLESQARDNKERADAYERQILTLLADGSKGGPACELGAAADRVRDKVRDLHPR